MKITTVAEINAEIENINQTIAQVQAQIVEKRALVEDLKKSNAKLVEQNLLKQRKPPSLDVQRKKIFELSCQVDELKNLQGTLKEKLEKANQELSEAAIRHRLEEYKKAEAYQLSLIQKAQDLLAQYVNAIAEIERHRPALELLLKIHADLNGKSLVDFGVNLESVIRLFGQAILSYDFDPSRIDRLNTATGNLLSQVDAICKGKRSFHKAQVQRGPTVQRVPHVDPLRQARMYEQHRLKEADDLSKALEGKTQIIQHNHR